MARGMECSKWSTQTWTPVAYERGGRLNTSTQTTLLSEVVVKKDRRPKRTAKVKRTSR